jgi:hypothetical protein
MYNPSQKVTEILSKFLEFDPAQLELGIWSGDLSLKNVNLRQDAIYPLLNKAANNPHRDPSKKPPLHMKLVSGTVGHMRIRIPWKRLVWGQGDVQMEISDVSIVLSFQSIEEAQVRRENTAQKQDDEKDKSESDKQTGVSKSYRDAKQRRLNDVERRHLKGMPIALYLNNINRRNLIEKEAAKAEEAKTDTKKKSVTEAGRIDRWLKNATSDFFWRFYAGLQGSIKKVRIVLIQDGVEVGCIVQSIDIFAGKDGTEISVNTDEKSSSEKTDEFVSASMSQPENFVYETVYEDGEHVDKIINQKGMGIFVRKIVSMSKIPKSLQFSSSVSADDYILRPVDFKLSFSFFYPFPLERRKKRAAENQSLGTKSTGVSTDSAASSKRRRGKRDRVPPPTNASLLESSKMSVEPKRELKRNLSSDSIKGLAGPRRGVRRTASYRASSRNLTTTLPVGDSNIQRLQRTQTNRRASLSEINQSAVAMTQLNRFSSDPLAQSNHFSSGKSIRSGISLGKMGHEIRSVLESPSVISENPQEPVPKFECLINLQEIRVVFSNRHYELLNYFISTVRRIQNGRPEQMIRSTRDFYTTAASRRDTFADYREQASTLPPDKAVAATPSRLGSLLSLSQIKSLRSTDTGDSKQEEVNLSTDTPLKVSPRSIVVRQWWKYAMDVILWEIRNRKHSRRNFLDTYLSFDWDRQSYKRQEYIDLYIATKLENNWQNDAWPFEGESREEKLREGKLLQIEDELSLEQILLYRSIAKSIQVKGIKKMPTTVLETYSAPSSLRDESENSVSTAIARGGKAVKSTRNQARTVGSTLMFLLQNKYEVTRKTRRKNDSANNMRWPGPSDDPGIRHTRPRSQKKSFSEFESNSDSGSNIQSRGTRVNRSISNEFQAGNFYSSAESRRDSRVGFRTIATKGRESLQHTQTHAPGAGGLSGHVDNRMRIVVTLRVKCIDLMVVEEDYIFDMPVVDLLKSKRSKTRGSPLESKGFLEEEESSSDQLSDLSVLTDDQNFFAEGSIGTIAEEEEDSEEARLSSTDFLRFGLPENVILRLTIASIGSSLNGISGGPSQISLSVGRIGVTGCDDTKILGLGPAYFSNPVSEVSIGSKHFQRRKNREAFNLDESFRRGDRSRYDRIFPRTMASKRAVWLIINRDKDLNTVQCDIAKLNFNVDLKPVAKLLALYSKSEIKHPSTIIPISSHDVARKLMVNNIAASSRFGANISIAFRLHGFEINLPFSFGEIDTPEASDVYSSSTSGDSFASEEKVPESQKATAIFSANTFELYTGRVVDEICATTQEEQGDGNNSVASGYSGKINMLRSLEMIDIVELTSLHDAFDCNHWVSIVLGCHIPLSTFISSAALDSPLSRLQLCLESIVS